MSHLERQKRHLAYIAGWNANVDGKLVSSCPYRGKKSILRISWLAGWYKAAANTNQQEKKGIKTK